MTAVLPACPLNPGSCPSGASGPGIAARSHSVGEAVPPSTFLTSVRRDWQSTVLRMVNVLASSTSVAVYPPVGTSTGVTCAPLISTICGVPISHRSASTAGDSSVICSSIVTSSPAV